MISPANVQPAQPLSRFGPENSTRRYRQIASAALSALFGKGTSILVNVAIVPLTVRYLGAEGYGLWITISSAIMMFFVLDIGIASTLTNLISEAYAEDNHHKAASCFATAFWAVIVISATIGLTFLLIWSRLSWVAIFHVQDPTLIAATSRSMAVAIAVFLVALPAGLVTRVLAGYQELHPANLFASAGSILSLVVTIAVVSLRGSLPVLIAGYAASPVVANIACMVWLCVFHKPWLMPRLQLVSWRLLRPIFRSGLLFFGIQLGGLVVFSSDSLVISHFLSPTLVTPYSVTWRLMSYIAATQMLFFPALWPAYSEAWARGDRAWIQLTYSRVRKVTFIVLAAGCPVALLFARPIIQFWAGPSAVPSESLISLMCLWIVIFAVTTNQSCLLGATGRVAKQAIASVIAALVNLLLSITWVRIMGPPGVLLATIVSYVVFILGIQIVEVRKILHGSVAAVAPQLAVERAPIA